MLIKTILNHIEKHASFVYQRIALVQRGPIDVIEVEVQSRRQSRPVCSGCSRRGARYDTLAAREFPVRSVVGHSCVLHLLDAARELPAGVPVEVPLPAAAGKGK